MLSMAFLFHQLLPACLGKHVASSSIHMEAMHLSPWTNNRLSSICLLGVGTFYATDLHIGKEWPGKGAVIFSEHGPSVSYSQVPNCGGQLIRHRVVCSCLKKDVTLKQNVSVFLPAQKKEKITGFADLRGLVWVRRYKFPLISSGIYKY